MTMSGLKKQPSKPTEGEDENKNKPVIEDKYMNLDIWPTKGASTTPDSIRCKCQKLDECKASPNPNSYGVSQYFCGQTDDIFCCEPDTSPFMEPSTSNSGMLA